MYVQIGDRKVMYQAIVSITITRENATPPGVLIELATKESAFLVAPSGLTAKDTVANLLTCMKRGEPYLPGL